MTHKDLTGSQVQSPYFTDRESQTQGDEGFRQGFPAVGCQDAENTQVPLHFINDKPELTDVLTDFVAGATDLTKGQSSPPYPR